MRKLIFILSFIMTFACVTQLYSAIGNVSGFYKVNIGDKAVYDDGVVNMSSKKLLKLITSEALDKSNSIVLFGENATFDLVKEVANLYGYKVEKSSTDSFIDGAQAPVSSFIVKDFVSNGKIEKSGLIKAIEEAEESGYKVEKVTNAFDKLALSVLGGVFGEEQLKAIANEMLANEDVQTFFSRVKDIASSQSENKDLSSKDVQYAETLDLIAYPLGHYLVVPMLNLIDSVLIPFLPGGSMPAAFTRIAMLNIMFPMLDFALNTFPVLRPVLMDVLAPITSNMH